MWTAIEPKIEQLLEALDRIAEASERSATALEILARVQSHAPAADVPLADAPVDAPGGGNDEPDMDLARLDGIG